MTIRTCTKCGATFEPTTAKRNNRYYNCPECAAEMNREYCKRQRARRKEQASGKVGETNNRYKRLTNPVEVIAVAPFVNDWQERESLRVFVKSRWPYGEFVKDVEAGNFDGLIAQMGDKRFEVRQGEMVEAGVQEVGG